MGFRLPNHDAKGWEKKKNHTWADCIGEGQSTKISTNNNLYDV